MVVVWEMVGKVKHGETNATNKGKGGPTMREEVDTIHSVCVWGKGVKNASVVGGGRQ